jgi:hypothetical protein
MIAPARRLRETPAVRASSDGTGSRRSRAVHRKSLKRSGEVDAHADYDAVQPSAFKVGHPLGKNTQTFRPL